MMKISPRNTLLLGKMMNRKLRKCYKGEERVAAGKGREKREKRDMSRRRNREGRRFYVLGEGRRRRHDRGEGR